jgi:hypothetical protein
MSWWTDSGHKYPVVALVRLDPLDVTGPAQTLRVSESSTSVIRLAPGRYQLTTTSPLSYNRQSYGWSIELPLIAPVNHVRLSQENAVRLAPQVGIEPGIPYATDAPGGRSTKPHGDEADDRAQITALLTRWVASWKSRSLQAQMSCYGPRLANYLQQGSVSREQVQRQKQKMLQLYKVTRLYLSSIELNLHGSEAVATGVKSWDFRNDEVDSRGRSLVSLGLAKLDSRWVIISEQEYTIPAAVSTKPHLATSRAPVEQ